MYSFPDIPIGARPHCRVAFLLVLCLRFASLSSCSGGTQNGGETTDSVSAESHSGESLCRIMAITVDIAEQFGTLNCAFKK